jgi:hypothetical protein
VESTSKVGEIRFFHVFSDEWFADLKVRLSDLEATETKISSDKSLSNGLKVALSYKFLATAALVSATPKQFGKIIDDAEQMCNKIGISLLPHGTTLARCPTRRHRDCKIKYVHSSVKYIITCRCKCHEKK